MKKKLDASLKNIFNILDNEPSIVNLNAHLTLRYKTDKELINKLNEVTKEN